MNEPQGPTPNPYDLTRFTPMNGPTPPWPASQVPPSWPPMPPGPPHGNRRLIWALMGLVCVLTAVVVALVVILPGHGGHEIVAQSPSTTSTPATSYQQAPVPISALDGLLPDRGVVSSAVADPAIDLVAHGEGIDNDDLVDADCQGILSATSRAYTGSGWTAIRWQRWNSPAVSSSPHLLNHVLVSVASYRRADAALAFYTKESDAWAKCARRIINARYSRAAEADDQLWIVDWVGNSNGVLAASTIGTIDISWSCAIKLTARNNVAVHVNACGFGNPARAAQGVLNSITQKIDAAS